MTTSACDSSCSISLNAKKADGELQARFVLFEQFELKKTFDAAFSSVQSELGPQVMSETSAKKWFAKFKKPNFNINKNVPKADRALAKNGNFLRTKRALYFETSLDRTGLVSNMSGTSGRFRLVRSDGQWQMVDTFNGQKRRATLDWSAFDLEHNPQMSCFGQFDLHFLNDHSFLGHVHFHSPCGDCGGMHDLCGTCGGTYDLEQCRFEITDFVNQEGVKWKFIPNTDPTQPVGLMLDYQDDDQDEEVADFYQSVELKNGLLAFGEMIEIPIFLGKDAVRHGDTLVGIRDLEGLLLLEVELADDEVAEHEIDLPDTFRELGFEPQQLEWLHDKCVVSGRTGKTNKVLIFNLPTKKWTDPGIEVAGQVNGITFGGENVVIVETKRHVGCPVRQFYRFNIGSPESLLNLTWAAMRRRAQFQPEFYEYVLDRLPRNFPLGSPWVGKLSEDDWLTQLDSSEDFDLSDEDESPTTSRKRQLNEEDEQTTRKKNRLDE